MKQGAGRKCLKDPIPEIGIAADLFLQAEKAHLQGNREKAAQLIEQSNKPALKLWIESIIGKSTGDESQFLAPPKAPTRTDRTLLRSIRMPTSVSKKAVLKRDGMTCRYCNTPLVDPKVRSAIVRNYPKLPIWGRKNESRHAALYCMWLQYDHVVPFSRGGTNEIDNIVACCAPCNFGKMSYSLEELGLIDPRQSEVAPSPWTGLVGFMGKVV